MPDNIKELLQHGMPFMVAASGGGEKLNITRVLEAVIIAVIVGAGAWFMLIPEMKTEFKYITRDVQSLKHEVKELDDKVTDLKIEIRTRVTD